MTAFFLGRSTNKPRGYRMENIIKSRKIGQIGVIVMDVEKTARIWADMLGIPLPEIIITETVEQTNAQYMGNPTPARAKIMVFRFDNIDIEFVEPLGEPSTWKDQLKEHGSSIHHLAFRIKGMQEKVDAFAENGIDLVQKGDFKGGRYAYLDAVEDFGMILELLENENVPLEE
ncbi:MAG: VOC family protein [Anaerolineales bacterium]|nr:VOC family protein [Anaerolineales bacterium]